MKKPEETVTIEDLKNKVGEVIDELKTDFNQSGSKIAIGSAVSFAATTAASYFLGKRKGKRANK